MKLHKAGLLAMVLVLMSWGGKTVWAQDEDLESGITGVQLTDFIKERSYIGGIGTSATIDQWGDFNGTNFFTYSGSTSVSGGVTYTTASEQDIVPAITRQFGFGVLLGHRQGPWAAEVSFWRSDHTSTFYTTSGGAPVTINNPSSLQAINIDFKRYFFTAFPTQPFIDLGVSFPWLWVQNGSYLGGSTNNETISGIGLNLGLGGELYLDNGFSIVGGLYQRWTEFDQINGASKIPFNKLYFNGNPSNVGALAGDGLQFYIGTTYGIE